VTAENRSKSLVHDGGVTPGVGAQEVGREVQGIVLFVHHFIRLKAHHAEVPPALCLSSNGVYRIIFGSCFPELPLPRLELPRLGVILAFYLGRLDSDSLGTAQKVERGSDPNVMNYSSLPDEIPLEYDVMTKPRAVDNCWHSGSHRFRAFSPGDALYQDHGASGAIWLQFLAPNTRPLRRSEHC
jgi:hypothetical protein